MAALLRVVALIQSAIAKQFPSRVVRLFDGTAPTRPPAGKDRPQISRVNATGFSFAVVGPELLMLLPFKAMLLLERARGRKAGGPPLLAPSFKVQRKYCS